MLTTPDKPHEQDTTLSEIANLLGQFNHPIGSSGSAPKTRTLPRSMKW